MLQTLIQNLDRFRRENDIGGPTGDEMASIVLGRLAGVREKPSVALWEEVRAATGYKVSYYRFSIALKGMQNDLWIGGRMRGGEWLCSLTHVGRRQLDKRRPPEAGPLRDAA